jgi:HAD superfamily phosphoserine phosphatase-like hydrolase
LSLSIFVDYDGTITDVDTFDVLVRSAGGDDAWAELERELAAGRISLREALRSEAALVRLSRPEALAFLESHAHVDPTFAGFVAAAHSRGAWVGVVSAGIGQVIAAALERAGVDVPVFANDVDFDPAGWRMTFIDDSVLGHDKAARVRAARDAGARTVYVGDGLSDFAGALEAEVRFAKKDRALERYCRERGVACTSFSSFDEITKTLFSP